MRTRGLIACTILLLGMHSPLAGAAGEPTVLTAEGSYTMGNGETPAFAEAMALQQAKQAALEQAGIYLESYTDVRGQHLAADETQSIAGGLLQVEILEKYRTASPEGLRFHVKIKATVTPESRDRLTERLREHANAHRIQALAEDFERDNRARELAEEQADLARNDATHGDNLAALRRLKTALETAAQIKGERKRTVALANIAAVQAEVGHNQAALETVASIPVPIERDSVLRTLSLDRAKAGDLAGARRFADAIQNAAKKADATFQIETQERSKAVGF